MYRNSLFGMVLLASPTIADPGNPEFVPIRSSSFEIEYSVNESALPLDSVHLWYTRDDGQTWLDGGVDRDRQSPLTFQAPAEGRYGFFLVLTNSAGGSQASPDRGARPQLTAMVDFTPPVAQLQPLRVVESSLGERTIEIHWSAIDANLGPRPINLMYQRLPETTWEPVIADALANTGQFDWRTPRDLSGAIAIKAVVADLGGHRIETDRQIVDLPANRPTRTPQVEPILIKDSAASAKKSSSADSKGQANELYQEGLSLKKSGDNREAISRFREVVRLDPLHAEAFSEMGGALYELSDYERSIGAYDLALKLQPSMRNALLGSANAHRQRKEYPSAADKLRTLLHFYPKDADGWLYLGDIAIFQGDESLAREYYTRATQIDTEASRAISEARQRLAMMAEASRSTQGGKK